MKTQLHININGETFGINYEPAESSTGLFGGNSNWRGPFEPYELNLFINSLREIS